MRYSSIVAAVFFAAGCFHGPDISSLPFVKSPSGTSATFSVGKTRMTAELIAVQDTGYVIIDGVNRILFVPFGAVRNLRIPTLEKAVSGRPSDANRRALRLASRYPQGLSQEILQTLLARRSQPEVVRLQ